MADFGVDKHKNDFANNNLEVPVEAGLTIVLTFPITKSANETINVLIDTTTNYNENWQLIRATRPRQGISWHENYPQHNEREKLLTGRKAAMATIESPWPDEWCPVNESDTARQDTRKYGHRHCRRPSCRPRRTLWPEVSSGCACTPLDGSYS